MKTHQWCVISLVMHNNVAVILQLSRDIHMIQLSFTKCYILYKIITSKSRIILVKCQADLSPDLRKLYGVIYITNTSEFDFYPMYKRSQLYLSKRSNFATQHSKFFSRYQMHSFFVRSLLFIK